VTKKKTHTGGLFNRDYTQLGVLGGAVIIT